MKYLTSLSITLVVLLIASVALGQQRNATQSDATTVFRSARDLITDGEWSKAQEKFNEYVSSFPNEKNVDAALYWLAYAQNKLGRYEQARVTIERLLEKYPNSSWRDDARVLLAQIPGGYAVISSDLAATVIGARGAVPPPLEDAYVDTPSAPLAPVAVTAMAQGIAAAPYVGISEASDS
ncbi:MAG TPA: tetratricopeptide repeat protein, partial [Pyrinomonadaceae bacterium]|nr:tetratricopeptide repeat protein [Pyrinomonadaceae bacterium]